ncbi:MAG: SH3 domain-containing protein [Chloroflexi bacterium]|nr:SH3 domain-containing protein [Chloroflexota bacterium]
MLQGKGLWAYRSAELDRALELAPRMGATHILYKVGQGTSYYSGMRQIADKIHAAGLIPFAWVWLLLDAPIDEAQLVPRAFEDGFRGFVFDTEAARCRNRFEEAAQLGRAVRLTGVDLNALYNCSFPNISHHRDLPYDQMNEFCLGGLMPMSYGTFFAPDSTVPFEQQARRVIDEWTYGHYEYWCRRWGYRPPIYPILGPYHGEYAQKRMSPEEFQIWLDRLAVYQPTFFSVFTAAVLNENLLPLIKSFALGDAPDVPAPGGVRVEVVSPEVGYLNVRQTPSTELAPIARVDHGAVLETLEPVEDVRNKVGQDGQWLRVRTPDAILGYIAAWYVRLYEDVPRVTEGIKLEVVSSSVGFVNIRPTPSLDLPPVSQVDDGVLLETLDPLDEVRSKLGNATAWIHVRTADGVEGYVSAAYVVLAGGPAPYITVRSAVGLNVRQSPSAGSSIRWRVVDGTVLEVLEDPDGVGDKLSKDTWVKVRTPSLRSGYVNGLYVRAKRAADKRLPVADVSLPYGECAWVFGIHAAGATSPADFRFLFDGKGKTGWVLFSASIGSDPNHGDGHDFTPWSYDGYGVIVRLNHRYHSDGTLPVRSEYPDFALSCANFVRNSRGCHIWIIGNEQNNVREHPGGAARPVQHITPQLYAEAFNLTRRRIKEVQPEAIVVPGAVDPYNTSPWTLAAGQRYRPLDYFKEMLDAIDDLDGIALHTYTHWMDPNLVTAQTVFQDAFLPPGTPDEHYYDFLAYRAFAEAIPLKWRERPIYITETNHWLALEHQPRDPREEGKIGWVNADKGWVQAAYAEIERWNRTPHAQQIHCLLLYRWAGDEWAIEGLGELHNDIRKALDHDYRWRR